jgi:DNA-binding NtrC family response regulator
MVKNLNGEVGLCSDQEKGTLLEVILPVYHPAAGMDQAVQITPSGDGSILVVDDMPRQRDIAVRYLSSFGYQVDAVGNGEEAMEYLKDHHPSLIMLDMVMPGHRDGLDTYTDLAKAYPTIPVVLVSGYGSNDRILEALTRGARDYIQKPYALDAIGRVVRHYIHQHAQN